MAHHGELLRAGSWVGQDGGAALLKTVSDVMMQVGTLQHPKVAKLAEEPRAADAGKTNSVDSSSTAARGGAHLMDTGTLLPPLRQISLDVIHASELGRGAGVYRQGSERHNIFQDVFNELAGKEELAPLQAGALYTLPSMQFLESMLSDFEGSRGGASAAPGAGPLDLPADAFDLPDTWGPSTSAQAGVGHQGDSGGGAGGLRPTPFDQSLALQQQQQHAAMIHQRGVGPSGHRDSTSTAYSGFVPMGTSASAPVVLAPAAPAHSGVSGMSAGMSVALPIPRAHTAAYPTQLALDPRLQQQHLLALQQQHASRMLAAAQAASQPVRGPAAPQPKNTPRRQQHPYADFDYEEPEVSLQTSKSGRVRKVASFTGVKRRLDVAASESRDSRGSMGADATSGEVGSKGSKGKKAGTGARGRKGRRTVCLNCGCTQTPQWRCGPLGPRTLCNACGVRYKKDLPLNCWPIRDGMVLPPGALLPPGFVCPPGITIHTQPADFGDS